MAERPSKLDQLRTFREARFHAAERAAVKPEASEVPAAKLPTLKKARSDE